MTTEEEKTLGSSERQELGACAAWINELSEILDNDADGPLHHIVVMKRMPSGPYPHSKESFSTVGKDDDVITDCWVLSVQTSLDEEIIRACFP